MSFQHLWPVLLSQVPGLSEWLPHVKPHLMHLGKRKVWMWPSKTMSGEQLATFSSRTKPADFGENTFTVLRQPCFAAKITPCVPMVSFLKKKTVWKWLVLAIESVLRISNSVIIYVCMLMFTATCLENIPEWNLSFEKSKDLVLHTWLTYFK